MSSLKQRAMQCSGHIPASQYVPVYSRPHRVNQEIAPIMPKPPLDDPYNSRTQSIHEAVKLWLESSPNSVIAPVHHPRSPSSGSPPSNLESIEQQTVVTSGPPKDANRLSDISLGESNNERFYDVGSGELSPEQVPIEQSVPLASGSSASSPSPPERADNSTPSVTHINRAQDVGAAALPPMQKSGADSPECILPKDHDEKGSTSDIAPPSIPRDSRSGNQVLNEEVEASAQAREGKKNPTRKRRGGKVRPITEVMSPDKEQVYGLSVGSLSDFNSRAASRDFDTALALVVNEIDKPKPIDTLSCISDYSSVVGTPNVLLKPPRGLEKNVAHESEKNSAVVELPRRPQAASARQDRNSEVMRLPPPLPRAASARQDRNSEVLRLPPPLPRAASARQDRNSEVMRLPPPLPRATSAREDQSSFVTTVPLRIQGEGTAHDTTGVASRAEANTSSEIVPAAGDRETVDDGDKENISEAKERSLPANAIEQKKHGFCASLKKVNGVGSKRRNPGTPPRLTIQAILLNEKNLAAQQAQQTKMKSSDSSPVVISNGVAAVAGGFEFRHERSSRRTQSIYSEGGSVRGSVASAPNSIPQQPTYNVSPLHHMVSRVNRSKKQSAVAPAESQQKLRRERSSKSSEREASPNMKAWDKTKLEELRLKADAWESAKNATILNRYKQEESKIFAWEERKVAKATVTLSKVESDLEDKRAKAIERTQYEVAQAHKKAAEMKAHAEAKRAERTAKAAVQAQVLRVMGKSPVSCFRS